MAQQRKNVMRLFLDVSKARYMVTCNPEPKVADLKTGVQKVDRESNLPMWTTELLALAHSGGASVIQVTTVGQVPPQLSIGEPVVPEDLEALPWSNRGGDGETRMGIAFRASALRAQGRLFWLDVSLGQTSRDDLVEALGVSSTPFAC